MSCCGDEAYNTTSKGCCAHWDYSNGEESVYYEVYDLATEGCCECWECDEDDELNCWPTGVVYDLATKGCCEYGIYDLATETCCTIMPPDIQPCGIWQVYDSVIEGVLSKPPPDVVVDPELEMFPWFYEQGNTLLPYGAQVNTLILNSTNLFGGSMGTLISGSVQVSTQTPAKWEKQYRWVCPGTDKLATCPAETKTFTYEATFNGFCRVWGDSDGVYVFQSGTATSGATVSATIALVPGDPDGNLIDITGNGSAVESTGWTISLTSSGLSITSPPLSGSDEIYDRLSSPVSRTLTGSVTVGGDQKVVTCRIIWSGASQSAIGFTGHYAGADAFLQLVNFSFAPEE